jgi:hypothetical protein
MSKKKTATCTKCGEEKHSMFTRGMCTRCYQISKKKVATCEGCGKEKHTKFVGGMCQACCWHSKKEMATCGGCGKEKHGNFTKGMCQACYLHSLKETATCEGCGKEKHDNFTKGMCRACYQESKKKVATCGVCGKEKHSRFVGGMCDTCYAKTPARRERANARSRRMEKEDEGYRLAKRIARGIWVGLSGKKNARTMNLLGCTHEELLAHFEASIHEGCGDSPHIGHILVPKSWAVKYAGDEGVVLCYQLANLAYQNPTENIRLSDNPWYDCPFITDETIAVAKKFLAIAGTDEPELAELAAFVEAHERAAA